MNVRIPRFAPARAGLLAVLAAGALVGACSADLPTSAEVERMDLAAVEKQATHLRVFGEAGMTYMVDGKTVSAEEARALSANRIAQIEITKGPDGTGGTVSITTGESDGRTRFRIRGIRTDALGSDSGRSRVIVMEMKDGSGDRIHLTPSRTSFEGLVVIDGVIVAESAFRALSPERIEKVEVVKGARAAEMYPGNAAAIKGVIRITTKH